MSNIIQVKNISFKYSDQPYLFSDLSLNIEEGKWTTIIGQNGSGKSTLTRLIDGLLTLDKGKIVVDGLPVNDENINMVRNQIGIVFQNPEDQFVGATVEDDVAFGLENRQISRNVMRVKVKNSLKEVGMWDFRNRIPANLSGGQKQRVAIAGIIGLSPKIIILDEATSMLDPQGREDILGLVRKLKDEKHLTIVSITHDIDEATGADRVIVLNQGKIIKDALPEQIFSQTQFLKEIGLDIPFTEKVVEKLRKNNITVPSQYMNEEELLNWITELLSKK